MLGSNIIFQQHLCKLGQSNSQAFGEVEMHARVVLGVGKGVLFREVSSVQECPHRERGSSYVDELHHYDIMFN